MDTQSTNGQILPGKPNEKRVGHTEGFGTPLAVHEPQQELAPSDQEWKAGRKEWIIIIVLAIVSLMVALDATILVPVLPVSTSTAWGAKQTEHNMTAGYRERSSWQDNRYILDGNSLPLDSIGPSAIHSCPLGHIWPPSILPVFTWLLLNRYCALLPVQRFYPAFSRSFNTRNRRWRYSCLGTCDFD